jgi:hypothetical protein
VSRKQRYSLKPIRRNYTYSVDEIAAIYGLTPDTIFRWIRNDGLKRITPSRKYFVHGSDLISFLEKWNSKNKHPCTDGEMFCFKCRKPRIPNLETLKIKKQLTKAIKSFGRCVVCGTCMNKTISSKNWTENHPLHPDKNAPTKPPSGEHESPRECQT